MTLRYTLGEAFGSSPSHCFIQDSEEPEYPLIVTGPDQQHAHSKAARLVDLLNDPGMPFYLELIEPKPIAKVIPIRRLVRR
jgi:hypothetical protein